MKKTFTTAYNRTQKSITDCNLVKFTAPNKVKKSLSYATDINQIYDEFCRSGKLPLNGQKPLYDENFVKYDSLVEAQKLCDEASAYFNGLPATIKNQYGNSLIRFVKALNACDPFLVNQGLLNLPKKDDTSAVEVPSVEVPSEPQTEMNTATTD